MYDSTTAADIPTSALIVAGYMDGLYRWSNADWARFPNALKVGIYTDPTTAVLSGPRPPGTGNYGICAVVLDVEQGDATPADIPGWVQRAQAAGWQWPAMAIYSADEIPGTTWWSAGPWTGVGYIRDTAVATQFASPTSTPPTHGHYDQSLCIPGWPVPIGGPVVTPPTPAPAPPAPVAVDACTRVDGGTYVVHSDGGVFAYGGAPFYGSYPGLPPAERQGERSFVAIEELFPAGYLIIADDGAVYRFEPPA